MNPVLTVLVDAQVKAFQRRTKTGKLAQVRGFERRQLGRKDPQQQAADHQANAELKRKVTPKERIALIRSARKAKVALSKGASKNAFRLAREFYKMKNELMNRGQENGTNT